MAYTNEQLSQKVDQIISQLATLKRALETHKHTGLDSSHVDLTDQIESQGSLTAADGSTIDTTYSAQEAAVISNTRTRVGQIESALQAFGILD